MKKIFSLIVGLLCAVGTTYADNVTLGRTIEFDETKTDYTLVSATNATTTQKDGTGKTDKSGKAVYYKSTSAKMMYCYRNNNGSAVTAYNADIYAGFQTTMTEGYKFDLKKITAKVAVGDNFSYRIEILDKTGKATYTSTDYTIANYNKDNAVNEDLSITLENAITLTGNFDVRLYYWTAGTTKSKYLVPLELTVTGDLAQDKAVASKTTTITGLTINGTKYDDLSSLNTNKKLEINEKYKEAPTLVFTKTTTTKYKDNTENSSSVDVTAVATKVDVDGTQKWLATTTIGEDVYEVYFLVDQTKEMYADVKNFKLVADKADIAAQAIKVRAVNFSGDATVTVDSDVDGLSVPATLALTDGTDATLNVEYKSYEDVAEGSANITISAEGLTVTIPFTYSSTAGIQTIEDVTGDMTWDFTKAGTADILSPRELECVALANKTGYSESFDYASLKAQGKYFYRQSNKCWQGRYIIFNTTVPGTIVVTFANTGSKQNRSIKINGTSANDKGCIGTDKSAGDAVTINEFSVPAGEVKIEGYNVADETGADVRITNITFKAVAATTTDIQLSAAGMGTFSSTTTYELPEGLTAYTATCDGSKVTLTKVEDGIVAANQGVVLSGEKNGKYTLTPSTKESATDWTKNELKNTASKEYTTAADDQSTYVLIANNNGNGQFARLNGGQTIPVGKAYLTVEGNDAKTLSLSFGETNGINAVENNAEQNGAYYTLSGQKTMKPVKGLYIHNGKKYIAK